MKVLFKDLKTYLYKGRDYGDGGSSPVKHDNHYICADGSHYMTSDGMYYNVKL